MLKIYFSYIFVFVVVALAAQNRERVISGQLKSNDDGSPMPGVSITIKGTMRGTVTDINGRYSLSVPIGSVLVFSFIGMQTREVLVTENSLQSLRGDIPIRSKPLKDSWSPSILNDTTRHEREGATTLTFNTPTYKLRSANLIPTEIVSIRNTWWPTRLFFKNQPLVVNTNNDLYVPKGLRIQFNGAFGFNAPGQLPKLQSGYAQGRNINGGTVWQGADQQEIMSWGPPVKTLAYTGSNYLYDRNGTITAGHGNGTSVNTYNPYSFFQKGISTSYELTAWFPGISRSTTSLDMSTRKNSGTIPNNVSMQHNVALNMKRISFSQRLKADVGVLYNASDARLVNRGANIANIMGSMMLSAPTFSMTNGYSAKSAAGHQEVYQLPDGSVRSSAPGKIDNPYGLVALLPDRERSQRFLSSIGFKYDLNNIQINLSGSSERQVSNISNGVAPGLSPYLTGRRTDRNEVRVDRNVNLLTTYKSHVNYQTLTFSLGYQFRQEQREVSRMDGFGYAQETFPSITTADSLSAFLFSLNRNIHEVLSKIQYEHSGFDVQVSNRSYFSNTLKQNYVNLFPSFIVKVDLDRLLYIDFLNELKPFASISRTIRESPALFGNASFLSTSLSAQQYNQYFENREIVWNNQLKPETEAKFELGVRTSTNFNLALDFSYYYNTTYDMILPVWKQDQPLLQNAASVNNKGTNITISYNPRAYNRKASWGVALRWTKYNSVVASLDLPDDHLPLAGFSNIQVVAAKGETLGTIYGTTYLRDEAGRKIIGSDGFPIVDTQLKKIGNPIPHYLISLDPYLLLWKKLKLGFIVDFKRGGQVWNGTKAALNYTGRSQEAADLQHTANYVFDGVTADGSINTVPVSFYDHALPLQQNRWVRYGFSGVGEAYIEDASWIRLNEVSLSYRFNPLINGGRKEVALTFVGKNLFLITPYSGVDPGTALYGYSTGVGLDMFNAPSLKNFNLLITIKF